jgi:hypothetical protein
MSVARLSRLQMDSPSGATSIHAIQSMLCDTISSKRILLDILVAEA